jgi:alkanesulfonate monooxygenase SsuD/methylene tetrahydromethanopterin reductase-like flavin-dependent oxidoreductase (luciferase family)
MRLGMNFRTGKDTSITGGKVITALRAAERIGFDSLWVFDSIGRTSFVPDPLIQVSVAAAVTERIEVGTCILQVPLRHPVELAHRILTAQLMTGGRLRLGVGAGSTRADFDAVGQDYEARFKALREALPLMRRLWQGETVNGVNLLPPAAVKGGPPILIGSWAGGRWIPAAAQEYDGWIASAMYTGGPTLKAGVERFRDAGGKRAIVTNIAVDLKAPTTPLTDDGPYSLRCSPDEARARLQCLADFGFDDAVLVIEDASEENLTAVRALWPA